MPRLKNVALASGCLAVLVLATLTPRLVAQAPRGSAETLVLDDARVEWIEKSNVAALREGVIKQMELETGKPVAKGKPIGYLHSELAELAVKKAETMVKRTGPMAKAAAQKELATAVVAINERLNGRIKGAVSYEEMKKAEAELKVAHAMTIEADEQLKVDEAELNLAKQALAEHTIRAPFDGIVIMRMKHPGEKVGMAEAVVQLGNLDRLRVFGWVPQSYVYRVKEGQVVEFQAKLAGSTGDPLPIEKRRFRGKISFVDPQIQAENESSTRIYADFENPDHEMRPGLKGSLTIFLGSEEPAAATAARGGTATPPGAVGR